MGQRRGIVLVAVTLLAGACTLTSDEGDTSTLTPTTFPEMDSETLAADVQAGVDAGTIVGPSYNSDPPTSGPHADDYADCGVYRVEVPDIYQVHSLKRGTVVIQYQPTLQASARQVLEDTARELGQDVIVAPRAGLGAPIVVTAWTRMVTMPSPDPGLIREFHGEFAGAAPSSTDCPLTVVLAE